MIVRINMHSATFRPSEIANPMAMPIGEPHAKFRSQHRSLHQSQPRLRCPAPVDVLCNAMRPLLTSNFIRMFDRDIALPTINPTTMPMASHAPPVPRTTATAAPMPIPSAIPSPICMDGRFISVVPILILATRLPHPCRGFCDRVGTLTSHFFAPPFARRHTSGGFGDLSPIPRTFENSSVMLMPESVSNSAGTCAAILVRSPVILFIPVASPLPVETTVILSTLASGAASA